MFVRALSALLVALFLGPNLVAQTPISASTR